MKISVIIPSYNRATLLARALDSVLAQQRPVDEIIVVDDGSEDDTGSLITRNYPQVKLIVQTNQGVSAARNRGIEAAGGEWVALLDSDDEWLPNKIEQIQAYHANHPEIQLIHSEEIWIRHGKRVNAMNKHRKQGGWIYPNCLPLCVISPSAVVIKRQLLEQVGLFDESLPACEDYDLWLKICSRHPVGFIDQPLIVKYGGHQDQLSAQHWGMDRFRIRALTRILQDPSLTIEDQQLTRKMLKHKLKILLKGASKHQNQAVIDEFLPLQKQLQEDT